MDTLISGSFETVTPTQADALLARESSRCLASLKMSGSARTSIQLIGVGNKAQTVTVPASALRLLVHLLTEMSLGNAVTLIPNHAELTTQQAADILNVSRPYLVKLLDERKIPSRSVGKYRRVRFDDLMVFKQKDDDARARILDELSAQAQELKMGY